MARLKRGSTVIFAFIGLLIVGGLIFLKFSFSNNVSTVVKIADERGVDGCLTFVLKDGTSIAADCGLSPVKFSGKVIGNPQVGDRVEYNAPDSELQETGTYIRKL